MKSEKKGKVLPKKGKVLHLLARRPHETRTLVNDMARDDPKRIMCLARSLRYRRRLRAELCLFGSMGNFAFPTHVG
jgi:hypothetical protein